MNAMSAAPDELAVKAAEYVTETRRLQELDSTTEETFYPAIRDLLTAVLRCQSAFNPDPRSACKIDPSEGHGGGCPGSQ